MRDSHSNKQQSATKRPTVANPRSKPSTSYNEPTMHLARQDYWCDVRLKGVAGGGSAKFSSDSFPNALKKVAALFEIFVVHKITVLYKPLISDYKSGNILLGVDYATTTIKTDTSDAIAAHKHINVRISKDGTLPIKLPAIERFTKVAETNRDQPFAAIWYINYPDGDSAKDVVVGQLYLDYDITFRGMTT